MTDAKDEPITEIVPTKNKGGRPSFIDMKITVGGKESEVRDLIVARITTGAFAWVAAASAGVSPTTYYRWMARGETNAIEAEKNNVEPDIYGQFFLDVTRARANARLVAERAVMKENPLAWLRFGPGRDKPGEAGWTDSARVELTGKDGAPLHPTSAQRIDTTKLSDTELDDLERLLAKSSVDGDR